MFKKLGNTLKWKWLFFDNACALRKGIKNGHWQWVDECVIWEFLASKQYQEEKFYGLTW